MKLTVEAYIIIAEVLLRAYKIEKNEKRKKEIKQALLELDTIGTY